MASASAPTRSASCTFEAGEFHLGAWRTTTPRVAEHTTADSAPPLARTLAAALAHQPQWRYALGAGCANAAELRDRLRPYLQRELRHVLARAPDDATVLAAADHSAVAVWRRHRHPGLRVVRELFRSWSLHDALHALHFIGELERSHPAADHAYLECFGALPGSADADAVMREMTTRLDREGTAAYVECSGDDAVQFYARHGFQVYISRIPHLPRGAPPMSALWRPPVGNPALRPDAPPHGARRRTK